MNNKKYEVFLSGTNDNGEYTVKLGRLFDTEEEASGVKVWDEIFEMVKVDPTKYIKTERFEQECLDKVLTGLGLDRTDKIDEGGVCDEETLKEFYSEEMEKVKEKVLDYWIDSWIDLTYDEAE